MELVSFGEAGDQKHKYMVKVLNRRTGRVKTIKFGAYGMKDFTVYSKMDISDDMKQKYKRNYLARHKVTENWDSPDTAGFWSRWILWNLPTISASLSDVKRRYGL
jgi:hypothetical protein